ncbi:Mu transposase C-terminal domain-containing protein [Pseudomonas sp. F1_0610]|uniref:Mu transposase C-terminal domain-containing protein n=1 Tax=Pseudomonas sp. F1_0610 TaxID=3114284 RepID=UPI0039C1671F
MKDWYTAQELAGMKGLPQTDRAIQMRSKREKWDSRKREGTKALEYAFKSLPIETQNAIRKEATQAVLATNTLPVRNDEVQLEMLETEQQALVTDARTGVINAINNLMQTTGYTQTKCAELLIDMARAGSVDAHVVAMLKSARDGRGRPSEDGLPSSRSLLRFINRAKEGELAPVYRQKDMTVPTWAKRFLSFYQLPSKPSVSYAYQQFAQGQQGNIPSIHQVRRFLEKMGNVSREVGRMGARELKTLKPFIRRGFDKLLPTDIYSADGHTFDAEVQHPTHGRPFRPEITTVIDIATRKVVGWSVDLAESALAVIDALRYSCVKNGIPAIFYVDNGSGYKNAMMTDPAIGLMSRLGTEMVNSLPYNSQARGIIERVHQSIWIKAARTLPSYVGVDMDRQARLANFKVTRKAIDKGGEIVAMPLMAWEQFVEFSTEQVARYNNTPHSSLPKFTDPVTGKRRHMTPNECWAQHVADGFSVISVTDDEARPLFRPQELRIVNRCEINLFNNLYFAAALEEFHGEQLRIAFDIHDVSRVWVYNQEGAFLCTAELDGNKRDYMPQNFVERKRDERLKGREKRLNSHLEEVHAERYGSRVLEVEHVPVAGLDQYDMNQLRARAEQVELIEEAEFTPIQTVAKAAPIAPVASISVIPSTPEARYALWVEIDQNQDLATRDAKVVRWFKNYPSGSEFKAFSYRQAESLQTVSY